MAKQLHPQMSYCCYRASTDQKFPSLVFPAYSSPQRLHFPDTFLSPLWCAGTGQVLPAAQEHSWSSSRCRGEDSAENIAAAEQPQHRAGAAKPAPGTSQGELCRFTNPGAVAVMAACHHLMQNLHPATSPAPE